MPALLRSLLLAWTATTVADGKRLWSSLPVRIGSMIQEAYPVGNGRLGAMPTGQPGQDVVVLNLDSLWHGGPFENAAYRGGNPRAAVHGALAGIRDTIFRTGTGAVTELLGGADNYGSYSVLANLTVELAGLGGQKHSDYVRALDLDTAVHTTTFRAGGHSFETNVICSHPDDVCLYRVKSDAALPQVTITLSNQHRDASLVKASCADASLTFDGLLSQPGMQFRTRAVLSSKPSLPKTHCVKNALVVPASALTELTIVIGAGSNYDQTKGDAANQYSFKGADPGPRLTSATSAAAGKSWEELVSGHKKDYAGLFGLFHLTLPVPKGAAERETSAVINEYHAGTGNAYLEGLLFDYGRYLLIASSRPGSLPANLQGRWCETDWASWGADYHANINLQMNYWPAPQTGLGSTMTPLWDYMQHTWVPYGQQTADLLYGAPKGSWVVHDEMNIFGFTAMKNDASWANYPAAAAWMMHHVSEAFDYSGDVEWYRRVGYPLIKGVALFWLSQLQEDGHFKDGSLVVNPCNSPEHGPTTFGCTNYQQLIWELLDRIIATWADSADTDAAFLANVRRAFAKLDRGLHIGKWGQIQEWKLDLDDKAETHRHLSNLHGWYPGYSIATVGAANDTVRRAVETTLRARGDGNGPDANAGWAKVWRAACWAGLNNVERAFFQLTFAIDTNFAPNALSMYSGTGTPFQIDANFGLVGAINAMLIRDLPRPSSHPAADQTVILGPALPPSWCPGSVTGMRLRGGGSVDFAWDAQGSIKDVKVGGQRKATGKLIFVNAKGETLKA